MREEGHAKANPDCTAETHLPSSATAQKASSNQVHPIQTEREEG